MREISFPSDVQIISASTSLRFSIFEEVPSAASSSIVSISSKFVYTSLFSVVKHFVILMLLKEYNISLEGKHAVVIGRSNLVGKPTAQAMLFENATVTTCHSHTQNLADIIKTADIVVSAVGEKIVNGKILKNNCVVVDVGIFRTPDGKISGDVEFDSASEVAGFISPVPGGVGPMTVIALMYNLLDLYLWQVK